MSLQVLIILEVFLVLLGVAGYFFYTLFSLNKRLGEKNESLKGKLANAKSRAKGLRVQIQEQNKTIKKLEAEVAKKVEIKQKHIDKLEKLEQLKDAAQQAAENEKNKNKELQKNSHELKEQIEELIAQTNQLEKSQKKNSSKIEDDKYKELYHDLKNTVAYTMSGGEQALDMLRDRLEENGNLAASEELDKFKERYQSVGGMVGLVDDVEIFDEDEIESEAEVREIESAENLADSVDESLAKAQRITRLDSSNLEFTQQEMDRIVQKLNEVTNVKESLTTDLDKTASQLRVFISKAHLFQAQKEQIRMHKGTQKQLHRNLSNLGNDYRQLSRRFKTLEARNDILNAQIKNSTQDKESVEKLKQLREQLEQKEETMDRLILEKEMIEQQFVVMSEEADINQESSDALERLEAEHQLLEGQFLELLKELESAEN